MEKNFFTADKLRQTLAKEGRIEELIATYDGSLTDIPSMNNAKKWDFRAVNSGRMGGGVMDAHSLKRLEYVARYVDTTKKILDFGFGPADILHFLAKIRPDIDYTGIDISEKFVEYAMARYPRQKFACKNVALLEDGSFDQVLALEVFEHIDVPELKKIYEHLWRVLAKGGSLVVSVPIYEQLEDFTIFCSKCGNLENTAGHVRAFTPELMAAELKIAGFKLVGHELLWYSDENPLKRAIKGVLRPLLKGKPVTMVLKAVKIDGQRENLFPVYKKITQD